MADFYKNPYSFNATGQQGTNYNWGLGGGGTYNDKAMNGVGGPANPAAFQNQSQMSVTTPQQPDRYDEILKGYQDRYSRNVNGLDALGAAQANTISTGYANRSADAAQNLTGRGLSGTTVLDTTKTGIENEKQTALSDASAKLAAQKAQLDSSLSGDTLGFMERYKPQGPQMSASSSGSGSGNGYMSDGMGAQPDLTGGYSYKGPGAGLNVVGGGYAAANAGGVDRNGNKIAGELTPQQRDQLKNGRNPNTVKNNFGGMGAMKNAFDWK